MEGWIVMAWVMIQRQMVCVMSVYGPQTGRTGEKEQEFRDTPEKMMGKVVLEVMLCIAEDFNMHVGVAELGEEESVVKFDWGMRNIEDEELVEMVARNGMAIIWFIPSKAGKPQDYLS